MLELIEGLALANRLARGPLPVVEALGVAVQIADALEMDRRRGRHRRATPARCRRRGGVRLRPPALRARDDAARPAVRSVNSRGLGKRVPDRQWRYRQRDRFATWSPDGSRLAFSSGRDLYERPILAGGEPSRLFTASEYPIGNDWSADGRHLLYQSPSGDLWVVPLDGTAEPIAFAETEFLEVDGVFSPDDAWIAYTSDESGERQVYVRRFPGSGSKLQVSTTGGGMAQWRGDGRELFYIALDGKLMAVPLQAVAGRDELQALAPVPLFDARVGPPLRPTRGSSTWWRRTGNGS